MENEDRRTVVAGLLEHHLEHLRSSGLTDETIEKSGVYSVTDADEARDLLNLGKGAPVDVPALAFPYPGCDGYTRLRPDSPRVKNPDYYEPRDHQDVSSDEPEFLPGAKYRGPKGHSPRLYAPIDLRPEILDPKVPLYLVEGEKKALAACQSGLAAVAAGGVTCFGDTRLRHLMAASGIEVRPIHPDFAALGIPLEGREVVILFDNDIDTNDAVTRAAVALGRMLTAVGASVKVAYVPSADGEKVGLDDYLAKLPDEKRRAVRPLLEIEDSAYSFNVQERLDELEDDSYRWNDQGRRVQLRRAVRLASLVLPKKPDFDRWAKAAVRKLHVDEEVLRSFAIDAKKPSDRDPRRWLRNWMRINEVEMDFRTEQFRMRGVEMSGDAVFREAAMDAVAYPDSPSRQSLDDAFVNWKHDFRAQRERELRERLKYSAQTKNYLRDFVKAVTGAEDPVDIAVVTHFVWQTKRKLFDLPVEHHLMPILVGSQGGGKSVSVHKLLEPLSGFVDKAADLAAITDERQAFRLARSYVLVFDEMARAGKADHDILKNRITEDQLTWRVLCSNRTDSGRNRATFIGTSNYTVSELFSKDPTGLRRFYQLRCLRRLDWDAINSLDFAALWTSVDESGLAPILHVLQDVRKRQEDWRVRDAVEEWLAERCEVGGDFWTRAAPSFEDYSAWLKKDNRLQVNATQSAFGRRLKELLGTDEGDGWKKSGVVMYRLRLKPTVDFEALHSVNEPMARDEVKAS